MLQGVENSFNNNISHMKPVSMLVVMFMLKEPGRDLDTDVNAEKKVEEREEGRTKNRHSK